MLFADYRILERDPTELLLRAEQRTDARRRAHRADLGHLSYGHIVQLEFQAAEKRVASRSDLDNLPGRLGCGLLVRAGRERDDVDCDGTDHEQRDDSERRLLAQVAHALRRRAFADDFRVLALLLALAVTLTLARFGELGLVALDLVQVEIFVLDLDLGELGLLGRIRFFGFFLALFGFAFLAFLFFARLALGFGLRALGLLPRALFLLAPALLLVRLAARLFLLALAALVLLPVGFRLRLAVGFFLRLALFFLALRKRIQVGEQGVDRGAFRGGRRRLRCGRDNRFRFGRRHSCFDLLARAFLSFAL